MTNYGDNFASPKDQVKVFDNLDRLTVRIRICLRQVSDFDISSISVNGHSSRLVNGMALAIGDEVCGCDIRLEGLTHWTLCRPSGPEFH